MFFLVPYNIIDREDISLNQKMIAILLARIQDERGPNSSPSVSEIAERLKLSQEEVSLNLDFLVSKGILSRNQLEVREAGFEVLEPKLEEGRVIKQLVIGEDSVSGDGSESEEATEFSDEDRNNILEALELAEERVRERAARLRLNVRKKKRALNQAQAMEELEKARARLEEVEVGAEEEGRNERSPDYDDVDELLKLLQNKSSSERVSKPEPVRPSKEEARVKNRNFLKVSSVYNSVKSSLPKSKIDGKTPK